LAPLERTGGVALATQDRSTLKVPNGLAFSEFKGYEDWQYVAVSQTATSVKIIAAKADFIWKKPSMHRYGSEYQAGFQAIPVR
jgi:hypothetical protein